MSKSESNSLDRLEYFIAHKNEIAIVSLIGPVTKPNLPILEECISKLSELEPQFIIFNLRDIREVKEPFYRPFSQMLALARKKGTIRICGLNPQLKDSLMQLGLLRQYELTANLNDALKSIMLTIKKVA